mgnify:CR=1 FL=1
MDRPMVWGVVLGLLFAALAMACEIDVEDEGIEKGADAGVEFAEAPSG